MKRIAKIFMNKKIRTTLYILLMVVIVSTILSSCFFKKTPTPPIIHIDEQLSYKYGISFCKANININNKEYYYPQKQNSLVFSIKQNKDMNVFTDDLIVRSTSKKISKIYDTYLGSQSIVSKTVGLLNKPNDINETNININPNQYINKYKIKSIKLYVLINRSSISKRTPSAIISNTLKLLTSFNLNNAKVYGCILNENDYIKCVEDISNNPEPNQEWFKNYNSYSLFTFNMDNTGHFDTKYSILKDKIIYP